MSRYPWNDYPKTTEPAGFRVVWTSRTSATGCYGWASDVRTFATGEEAVEVANKPMGIAYNVCAQRLDGKRWVTLYERDRRKKRAKT